MLFTWYDEKFPLQVYYVSIKLMNLLILFYYYYVFSLSLTLSHSHLPNRFLILSSTQGSAGAVNSEWIISIKISISLLIQLHTHRDIGFVLIDFIPSLSLSLSLLGKFHKSFNIKRTNLSPWFLLYFFFCEEGLLVHKYNKKLSISKYLSLFLFVCLYVCFT